MDTICKSCVFATWDGNKQAGCDFNRLEKFEEAGTLLLLEEEGGLEYARIVGRFCNTCRDATALEDRPARKWKDKVRKDVTVQVAIAVYVESPDEFEKAIVSLSSAYRQTVPPKEIILIHNLPDGDVSPEYPAWFATFDDQCPWRIECIKGVPTLTGCDRATYEQAVDITMQSNDMVATFFSVCRAGYVYPSDYIRRIDHAINDEMRKFVALLPDSDGNGALVMRNLHLMLGGNRQAAGCSTILEKIQAVAEEEGTGHMITLYGDLPRAG